MADKPGAGIGEAALFLRNVSNLLPVLVVTGVST